MTREHLSPRRALLFIAASFGFSWLLIAIFVMSGGEWGGIESTVVSVVFMWIPGLTALYLQKFIHHEGIRKELALYFKPNRWFFAAWLMPVLIALATNEVGLMLPGTEYSPDMAGFFERFSSQFSTEQMEQMKMIRDQLGPRYFWVVFVQGLIGGITVNAVFALGEELGWRGYLLRYLGGYGFWRSSLLIGCIWGVWHAPIILLGHNFPQNPVPGVFVMILFCVLAGPLYSYVRLKARSVCAAAIFHGSINGMAGLPLLYVAGGSDLTIGVTGLSGCIVLAAALVLLWGYEHFTEERPFAFAETDGTDEAVVEVEREEEGNVWDRDE